MFIIALFIAFINLVKTVFKIIANNNYYLKLPYKKPKIIQQTVRI